MITTKSAIRLALLAITGCAGAWADDPQVAVRLFGSDVIAGSDLRVAKDIAAAILATAGVDVRWQEGAAIQPRAETIDMRFGHSIPRPGTDGALAESYPFLHSGVRITVFFDRLAVYANKPRILGHVLAHEIGRVLRGTNAHSRTGVMKAHWDYDDLRTMRANTLEFTRDDALAIASHLAQSRIRTAD